MRKLQNPIKGNGDEQDKTPPVLRRIIETFKRVPRSELRNLPRDLSKNADHYLYGSPKR
jgi:hypothetical protein